METVEANPCCEAWKSKYKKMAERRSHLRGALDLIQPQFKSLEHDFSLLQKACDDHKKRAEVLEEEKINEASLRASLEKQIADNANEIDLLKQEKSRAEADKLTAQSAMKQVENALRDEKHRADEANNVAHAAKRKQEEYQALVETLRKQAESFRLKWEEAEANAKQLSDQVCGANKLEELQEELKKRANLEMSLREDLNKAVEFHTNKSMEEKCRADNLSLDLQRSRQRIEILEGELKNLNSMLEAERMALAEEKRLGDVLKLKLEEAGQSVVDNEKRASEEKCRGDNLVQELENVRQQLKDVEQELHEVKQLSGVGRCTLSVSPDFASNQQTAKLRLFQEQLKFEKKRVKHFKEVIQLEKDRQAILQQELHEFRQDFHCLLQQLDALGHTFRSRNRLNKRPCLANAPSLQLPGSTPSQLDICRDADLRLSSLSSRDESCHLSPSEPAHIAMHHKESPSASFSDGQSLGSQGRAIGSLTTSTGLAVKNVVERSTISMRDDGDRVGAGSFNGIQSVNCDLGKVIKRRKSIDEVEPINFVHSQGKSNFPRQEAKLFALNNTLDQPMIKQMDEDNLVLVGNNADFCDSFSKSIKKRKVSHDAHVVLQQVDDAIEFMEVDKPRHLCPVTINATNNSQPISADPVLCSDDDLVRFEQEMNGNYMKLLELDDAAAEERFRMAIEMPLSPILPDLHVFEKAVELQTVRMPISAGCHGSDFSAYSTDNKSQNFCIVFSYMKDTSSITRISSAARSCAGRLSSSLQTDWVGKDIILSLAMEKGIMKEALRPREIVCAIFSLLLLNFAGVSSTSPVDFQSRELLDTFSAHIKSVLLNKDIDYIMKKNCDLDDLVGLSVDFLIHKKILLQSCFDESGFEILQLEESYALASTNLVVAGSIILASASVVTGIIGSVCDTSLKIIGMCGADFASALLILHTLAYICGDEYFTTSNYRSIMKAVKLFVTSVEGSLAYNANMGLQQGELTWRQSAQCADCPFARQSVCLDDVSSELIEELEECMKLQAESPFPLNAKSSSCSLGAILSSLNLVAAMLSWELVCSKVVAKVFQMLESWVGKQVGRSEDENVIWNAVILFLGDLGRVGAEACGYEDGGVVQMKQGLLSMLGGIKARNCDDVGMTILHALMGLYPKGNAVGKSSAVFKMVDDISRCVGRERTSELLSLMNPDAGS